MKKKIWSVSLVFLLTVTLVLVAFGCPPVEGVVVYVEPEPVVFELRVQSLHAVGSVFFEVFTDFFIPRVYELTGGRLIIIPFGGGMIVECVDTYDAVAMGVLEGAQSSSAYFVGIEPAHFFIRAALSPFTEPWQYDSWMWVGGGIEVAREIYAEGGLFLVGTMQRPGESLHLRERVLSMANFEGTKVRTAKGPTAALFAAIGGAPVMLPSGEIWSGLDKGLIDAAEWMSLGDNWGLGMHEVTNYFMWPSFHSPLALDDFFLSMEAWERLPRDLQVALETATREWSAQQLFVGLLADMESWHKFIAAGDEHIFWPEQDWERITKEVMVILEEAAGASPLSARIFESQMEFARVLGIVE